MFSYFSYGFGIQSEIKFPELISKKVKNDVIVRYGDIDLSQFDIGKSTRKLINSSDSVILYWRDFGACQIKDGSEIIVDPADGVSERKIRPLVLGASLAVLLHQRNLVVFHSSVIGISDIGAIAFLAGKGHGKSSMAAALYQVGNDMVVDDIMACKVENGDLFVFPGYPQFKLWPDTIKALGRNPEEYPQLYASIEKRVIRFSDRFSPKPLPLRGVFLLSLGSQRSIEPISKKNALLKIMPHWYGAMFQGEMMRFFGIENHLPDCKFIIDRVPVFQVSRPPDIEELLIIAEEVEQFARVKLS
jgi:hypothetical protein